ncbi:MAG: hypothetical protein ACI9G1_000692 [Pirellulaceae bacterium]|jgi:hypothetical protein
MSFLQQLEKKQGQPQQQIELVYINSRPAWLSLIVLAAAFGATVVSVIQLPRLIPLFDRNDFQTVWPLLLCLSSLPLLGGAIYGVGRWLKFGESTLFYAKGCNVVGGQLTGYVVVNPAIVNAGEITVLLVCTQVKRSHMTGKNARIEELCRVTRKVSPSSLVVDGEKYRVPIQLLIPLSGKATHGCPQEPAAWTLKVHGEMAGIDYSAKFSLQVN